MITFWAAFSVVKACRMVSCKAWSLAPALAPCQWTGQKKDHKDNTWDQIRLREKKKLFQMSCTDWDIARVICIYCLGQHSPSIYSLSKCSHVRMHSLLCLIHSSLNLRCNSGFRCTGGCIHSGRPFLLYWIQTEREEDQVENCVAVKQR